MAAAAMASSRETIHRSSAESHARDLSESSKLFFCACMAPQRCAWVDSAAATAYSCPAWVWDKRRSVPLVARWAALASRPDLHPGAGIPPLIRLPADCVHRALAPGAFDAELVGVLRLLEGGGFGL